MGSKIGIRRKLQLIDNVYWFDPFDIAAGHLTRLALGAGPSRFQALGVILLAYLRIKLKLDASGYDADFYPFDWRQSIARLGNDFAKRLKELGGKVDLVAHSMGGLVARSAIGQGGKCRRLIMLGTPNFGSFAPVMALRATYPVVRKVGELDPFMSRRIWLGTCSAASPASPRCCPRVDSFNAVDLYDLNNWPPDKLRPRPEILSQVAKVQKGLAAGADNHFLIAGVDQRTAVGLTRGDEGASPIVTPLPATEPCRSTSPVCRESGRPTTSPNRTAACPITSWSAEPWWTCSARAKPAFFPARYSPATRSVAVETVPEDRLRVPYYEGRRGGMLSQSELRHVTDEVASPDARNEAAAAPAPSESEAGWESGPTTEVGYRHPFQQIVVGRRRQHRIDLRFALGSITDVNVRAVALGLFRGVTPSGAASALDARMGGAVTELSRRRMFSSQVGEIFIMPTGRHPIPADLLVFVGLGGTSIASPRMSSRPRRRTSFARW